MRSKEYFGKFLPNYSLKNYFGIFRFIGEAGGKAVLEIGPGDGRSLQVIAKKYKADVYGIEQTIEYKDKIHASLNKKIFFMSILQTRKVKKIKKRFDVIIISRVLHHLVDKNPKSSRKLARLALENCFFLLKKSGKIIISEPLFEPELLTNLLFYFKKINSKFYSGRITIGDHWNNIGQPLVSYFSRSSIKPIVAGYRVAEYVSRREPVTQLVDFFFKRFETVIVLKNKQ